MTHKILWKNQELELRPLSSKDASRLYEIEKVVYKEPWSLDLLEESLAAPMTFGTGLFEGEELLGYAIYQIIFSEAHLLNIAILPEKQSRGLGRLLLMQIMEFSKTREAHAFFLEVRPSNLKARKLYDSMGFRHLMTREKYYADGEEALVMVRDLI